MIKDRKPCRSKKLAWMKAKKQIANNLKATPEQLADDLNGVLSKLQRQIMRELLILIPDRK